MRNKKGFEMVGNQGKPLAAKVVPPEQAQE